MQDDPFSREVVQACTAAAKAKGCDCDCRLAKYESMPGVFEAVMMHEKACKLMIRNERLAARKWN